MEGNAGRNDEPLRAASILKRQLAIAHMGDPRERRCVDHKTVEVESARDADARHADVGEGQWLARMHHLSALAWHDEPRMPVLAAENACDGARVDTQGGVFVDADTNEVIARLLMRGLGEKRDQAAEAIALGEMTIGDDALEGEGAESRCRS